MFKIIELTDSEDEAQQEAMAAKKAKLTPLEKKTAAQHLTEVLECQAASNINTIPFSINQKSKSLPATPSTSTMDNSSVVALQPTSSTVTNALEISNSPISSQSTKAGRQRSRKTQHQTMRLSPEMQFETITLDDEDHSQLITTQSIPPTIRPPTLPTQQEQQQLNTGPSGSAPPRPNRFKPPLDRARRDALVRKVAEVFISRSDTSTVIRQIAEERVRTNYLLAVFNMQEMRFTINSHIEMLRFQFRDRLKERRQQIINEELEQQARGNQIRQLQLEQEQLMQVDDEDMLDEPTKH